MAMPDRFDEVWKLRKDDGTFEVVGVFDNTSIYNQAYKGTGAYWRGKLFCSYHVKNIGDTRVVYCVPSNHELTRKIKMVLCEVEWDDGSVREYCCEPSKYKKGKRCEIDEAGGGFVFGGKIGTTSFWESFTTAELSGELSGEGSITTCVI